MKFIFAALLACAGLLPVLHAKSTVPWGEKKAYTVRDGKLFSVRTLSPVSPDFVGYSLYYDREDDGVSDYVDDSWKKAFAKGYYAYRPSDNPAMPFVREKVLSPERIVDEMKSFPKSEEVSGEKVGRYVVMDSDLMVQYHISRVMAMASKLGHPYFFLDRKEGRKLVSWKGENEIILETVTSTASPEGWLLAAGREKPVDETANEDEVSYWLINPETKEFWKREASFWLPDLSGTEWMDADRLVVLDSGRWDSTLSLVNVKTGKSEFRGRFDRNGQDTLIAGKEVWMTDGKEKAVRLYPLPCETSGAAVKVSLSAYDVPGSFEYAFPLCVTVTNWGKVPVSLPEGWGKNVVFLYEGEGSADDKSVRDYYMEPRPVLNEGRLAPPCVLAPGQSMSASSVYEMNDTRVFPMLGNTAFRVSLVPSLVKGAPGNGVFTSAPLT